MDNQKAVFYLCPIVNHQFSTDMQELELDFNQDTIQATIDICLHLTYFRNLTDNKVGPLQIVISVVSGQFTVAIPYQIISNKSYKSTSKIDLETYSSPFYVLQPNENSIIDEMVIFKLHVPIDQVETGNIKVTLGLQTVNQLAFDDEDSSKRLAQVDLSYNSILYIDSFLPCLFNVYGISLEGNIYSHLLGCKYGNFHNIYRHHFYQAIDHLVICYNKLRQKTYSIQKRGESSESTEELNQSLPLYIDMKRYEEYEQIKSFIEKRIFQEQSMKQHRIILQKFVERFIPEMTEKLLILWKMFLMLADYSLVDKSKTQFYEKLGIELKKRVQYRIEKPHISSSQIPIKKLTLSPSHENSLTRSQISEHCSLTQNEIAQNDMKQLFHDKSIYNRFKRIYVANLEIFYPSIKIRLNKSMKIAEKEFLNIYEPHVVVFVHGLGATSSAFSEFETFFKNLYGKNIFILNSTCNESMVDEDMQEMGRKLSMEVQQFINQNNFGQNFQLSFLGHSLGGLIIRSALPRLQMFRYNMKTLITLSTPHLGYFYHNSTINKAGMWAISKFSDNQIINKLLMLDSGDQNGDEETSYRNSYLYKLSLGQGMKWFEHVMFCGSMDDYFVSPLSAFATTKESIQMKKDLKSKIWEQMRNNVESNLINSNVYRLLVEFSQTSQTSIKDQLIGRSSHIMYLSSQDFIAYVLLVHKDMFL